MASAAVRRLVMEGSSLLARMEEDMPPEYIKWIVEFETFEEALNDVKEEIKTNITTDKEVI
jgi:hypothetical protein